mmetsp:Transcript_16866/g.21335  ORF Transcript_16866/g.21335 Transcript_16866/m.21335 type:complete len:212 (+) Transcript_16866:73-708(+)
MTTNQQKHSTCTNEEGCNQTAVPTTSSTTPGPAKCRHVGKRRHGYRRFIGWRHKRKRAILSRESSSLQPPPPPPPPLSSQQPPSQPSTICTTNPERSSSSPHHSSLSTPPTPTTACPHTIITIKTEPETEARNKARRNHNDEENIRCAIHYIYLFSHYESHHTEDDLQNITTSIYNNLNGEVSRYVIRQVCEKSKIALDKKSPIHSRAAII